MATAILAGCNGKAQPVPQQATEKITITGFKAYEKDNKQVVEWHTGTGPANYWQVQGSNDGAAFTTIAIVLGDDPRAPGTYCYSEKLKPGKSLQSYYRLCHVDTGGNLQLSEIIQPAK